MSADRSMLYPIVTIISYRPCYTGVRSGMATQLDLPLPEIIVDDFHQAWTLKNGMRIDRRLSYQHFYERN